MSRYRVLIADDEIMERKVLYKMLTEKLGDRCTVYQAENGREALQIYEEEKIQIAILDIEMPEMNGIEAARKIREQDEDCSIIFLTDLNEFSYAKSAIAVKALDYLLKPYDEKRLIPVLEEAMQLTAKRTSMGRGEVPGGFMDENGDFIGARLSRVAEIIEKYIRENYMLDLSMQDIAKMMNYSEAYFCKLFKQCFHKNFTSYLTELRVEEARKMLEEPAVNVKEIGKAVGYSDFNYFAKVFKRITGFSPAEYRIAAFKECKK